MDVESAQLVEASSTTHSPLLLTSAWKRLLYQQDLGLSWPAGFSLKEAAGMLGYPHPQKLTSLSGDWS